MSVDFVTDAAGQKVVVGDTVIYFDTGRYTTVRKCKVLGISPKGRMSLDYPGSARRHTRHSDRCVKVPGNEECSVCQ